MRAVIPLLLAPALFAQNSASITGVITDADGAVVANTPIEVSDTSTKKLYKATTSAKGEYTVGQLPAGTYDFSVQVLEFLYHPFRRQNIALTPGQILRLDIRLGDGTTLNTLGEDRAALLKAFAPRKAPEGPAPRLAGGRPDFSGMWMPGAPDPGDNTPAQKIDPQPWAEAASRERKQNELRDIPSARCLPNGVTMALGGFKLVHTPTLLVMLFEGDLPRQVYLDGRPHPKDPFPTWVGHSIGRWEGDTLVVDSVGFNDKTWLDLDGHPHTEQMHVIERYSRPDLGHLAVEMMVEDPGALNKPWVDKRAYVLDPKEEILENICSENNKDVPHLK